QLLPALLLPPSPRLSAVHVQQLRQRLFLLPSVQLRLEILRRLSAVLFQRLQPELWLRRLFAVPCAVLRRLRDGLLRHPGRTRRLGLVPTALPLTGNLAPPLGVSAATVR